MNSKEFKGQILKLLGTSNLKALLFAFVFFVMIVLTSVSLVKIHSTGGMAKAKKDAEIAYSNAAEKDEKKKVTKPKSEPSTETQTQPVTAPDSEQSGEAQSFALNDEQLKQVNEYYSTSAFVGDSVMLGFSQYCENKGEEFLGGPLFLVAGSFSLRNAMLEGNDGVLPTYKGEKMKVENALEMADNIDKVFLFFGINDFNMVQDPVNDVFGEYVEFIGRILEKKNVQINIVSTTYILKGKDTGNLTNENIIALNEKMKKLCEIEGYGFVNVADATGDAENGLKEEFCSDNYVHQTAKAYEVWAKVFQNFALSN